MTRLSRRWLWLLFLLPIALGLWRLRFDVEVLNLLPTELPVVQGLKLYQQHFSNARELLITVSAGDADGAESAAREIAEALRRETTLINGVTWQPPWQERPAEAAEFLAHLWLNQPPELFNELTRRLAATNLPATLAATRAQLTTSMSPGEIAQLSYDPYGLMRLPAVATAGAPEFGSGQELFASADGRFRLIFVEARGALMSYRECRAWFDTVKARIATLQFSNSPSLQIRYTGRPAFVTEIAGGMERDMVSSVLGTVGIIVALFWWAHRRWKPLLWLLTLLVVILGATMALGGLVYGTLSVVSMGFAAILLGLAVDYGLVLYQEAQAAPHLSAAELRRELGPSILWSSVTTAGAFLILNFSGLPGLAQLGSLVAIGIALAALVMLFAYLPFVGKAKPRTQGGTAKGVGFSKSVAWATTVLVCMAVLAVVVRTRPALDHTAAPLRPLHSAAYAALEEIKLRMNSLREPMWVVVSGRDEGDVARRLAGVNTVLEKAREQGAIGRFNLPESFWPRPDFQRINRMAARTLVTERDALKAAALSAGFTSNALVVTENMLSYWQQADATGALWPTNPVSAWITGKLSARSETQQLAIGMIYPATNEVSAAASAALQKQLANAGGILAGWEMIGAALIDVVRRDLWFVLLPMLALLFASLWLAFKRASEMLLSFATLLLSGLCLWAIMALAGWSWNLLNLMALPLLLGAGVDYSIHMQLALRRHGGDIAAARRTIGQALWLCGGTTVAGFGSLAWSSNAGLASLGAVCATGVGCVMLISIYLLPAWWSAVAGKAGAPPPPVGLPSKFYGPALWRAALAVTRVLPAAVTTLLCRIGCKIYWCFAGHRRDLVVQNFLPAVNGDLPKAKRVANAMVDEFARKLADLWRYESGCVVDGLFGELTGWEHFLAAQKKGGGVLLLTPHLGNWEFGAPLLARRGVKLLVITLAEPGAGFTEMRQESRARWGIETLVIGDNPFAFVEIIKRLESGATVALLVDRPPAASAVEVELFGKPFAASIAAAELARASGCVLLPVYLPRTTEGYAAHILPEIAYDRRALGDRESRRNLTQQILRAFEPAIRQHLEQWFHFVSIWSRKP